MIREVVFCDKCGRLFCKNDDESMIRLFKSREELKEELNEVGWVVSDEVLCEECIKYNKQLKRCQS